MKEQFLNLTGLTELVGYLKTSIANHKEILPYASNKLFPSVGDINTIYINTATNTIYRWDSSSKTYITLAKAVKSVAISEATENGKITLTVDGNKTTVPIHGLGSAAYTNSSAYSPAGHTHTKAQVGLGNVDNTADANKSVKHATTADSATTAGTATNVSAGEGTADAARHVWFSDSTTETKRAYSDKFKYNPVTNNLTVNVTGNAATASSVAWGNITGKPSTYTPSAHNHNDSTITSLNASKLFGTIDIARLPHGALERLVIVEDDTARFKLTTANIQLGDTVKVTKTEKMYYVVDESKLSSEAGYSVYTAGTATSVPWSGVTEKPSSYPPASHNHDERYYTETEMNSKLAEKATKVHTHTKSEVGLGNVDNTADATKSVKYAISAGSASSAAALTSNAGSSTQPVYFSGGKPVACSYTLGKSVPADALFTDHTYGNMKGATSSSAGSAGLVPAPNIGEQLKFLRADGTWVIPTNTTYSVGTTSYSGTTKLYTSTGSATDGTMTQNAITTALNGKSATGHTHNYAGSSTEGGSANSAVKLEVARKIGNASFDGTSDVTLSELGVVNPVYLTKGEYETKKANGTLNSDTYYYVGELGIYKGSQCIVEIGSIPIATTTTLGGIKPDGKTTFVDETGILRAKGGMTVTPKPVNNPTIENADASVTIKWQDPENTVISGSTFSTWAGTKLVMKETGYPANPNDGTLVADNTTRDKYKTTGYTVTGLTNGKKYYFTLFPYNTDGVYNYDAGNRLLGEPEDLKIVTFADGTDAEIAKMIEAHYAGKINISDYWAVGDKRTIHHNAMDATGVSESHKANDYAYVIIGIEHDDLVTAINGKTKAAITIQTERMLYLDTTTEYNSSYNAPHECGYMNSSNTNSGGWEGCARRTWCNNVYKQCLPAYIQNMMKQVKKLTSAGSTINTSNDYAFLPSEIEVFDSTRYSFAGEGKQYQYFKNATANNYKKPRYSSGYASGCYWERSPRSNNSNCFCVVSIDGSMSYDNASSTYGVAPCLCI